MVEPAEREVEEEMVERCEVAEVLERGSRTDIPRSAGAVERNEGVVVEEGGPVKGKPEVGRRVPPSRESRADGEERGEALLPCGNWRSSPGDLGGRIGAPPWAEAPKGIAGEPGERAGGRGCRSMSSPPAKARESRLAILVGTEERVGALPTELLEGEDSAPGERTSP